MMLLTTLEPSGATQIQCEGQFERGFLGGRRERAGGVTHAEEAAPTAAFGLEGIHRKGCVTAATRMHDVILTASKGPFHPQILQIERQGCVYADGRVQRIRRCPG